ncbi:MAG: hypothetical protein QM775_08220 [Pirellulales bacterium]
MKEKRPSAASDVPGVISDFETYTKDELMRRLRFRQHTWRALRHAGMPVIRAGNKYLVHGADVREFLRRMSENGGSSDA